MDSVGHALAQAGPSPLWIRSLQNVHFDARPVSWLKLTTPNGARRDAVPAAIADVLVDVDRPELGAVDGARRAGVETPACAQCLHTSDIRSQAISPFGFGSSMKRTSRKVLSVKWWWF
jgi:hypothetical protein